MINPEICSSVMTGVFDCAHLANAASDWVDLLSAMFDSKGNTVGDLQGSSALLESYSEKLKKSLLRLEKALFKSQQIVLRDNMDDNELEVFEGLTARFARTSDIFLNRYIRAAVLDGDPAFRGTFKDFLNQAAKQGLIDSVDAWMAVRELRNKVAHEYEEENLLKIFQAVTLEAPRLLSLRSLLR